MILAALGELPPPPAEEVEEQDAVLDEDEADEILIMMANDTTKVRMGLHNNYECKGT